MTAGVEGSSNGSVTAGVEVSSNGSVKLAGLSHSVADADERISSAVSDMLAQLDGKEYFILRPKTEPCKPSIATQRSTEHLWHHANPPTIVPPQPKLLVQSSAPAMADVAAAIQTSRRPDKTAQLEANNCMRMLRAQARANRLQHRHAPVSALKHACVYMCTCAHVHMRVHVCACMRTIVRPDMHTRRHGYVHAHTQSACTHAGMRGCTYANAHVHACTCARTHIYSMQADVTQLQMFSAELLKKQDRLVAKNRALSRQNKTLLVLEEMLQQRLENAETTGKP